MIYLDNAAASYPKAPGVADAVARALDTPLGNAGRSSSMPGLGAARIAFEARESLASFLGAPEPSRMIFTKNATEALNLAIMGSVPAGGLVAMSTLEHNAVARPVRRLAAERGVRVTIFRCDTEGRPDRAELEAAIGARPDLLAIAAASNVTGAVTPFEEIVARCRAAGIPVLVDGSQAVGHMRLALGDIGPTAFCFSGHKGLLGPEGTGGLWLDAGFEPEPLLRGGTGADSAADSMPGSSPERYEAGTQNAPALAGLLAALRYLGEAGPGSVERREAELRSRLVEGLARVPRLRVLGPGRGARSVPVVSVIALGTDPGELALELGKRGVAARPGLHCAPGAHRELGTIGAGGTLRLSPGYFTEPEEIDEAVSILEEILRERSQGLTS